jgi:hypothetical protein
MYSPETISRIDQLRAIAQSRKLTLEEQQEAIRLIRAERVGASYASAGAKAKKAASAPADGAAILAAMQQALAGIAPPAP